MPQVRNPDGSGTESLLLMQYGDEGQYLGPAILPEDQLNDVHNVELRDDDVLLLSYPKSGCHWLWEMTRMLRAGTATVGLVEKEKYMMEFTAQAQLRELPSPRTFNTHYLFRQLPPKAQSGHNKMIFIYRNPKDTAVSFYNHHTKFPEYDYKGKFHDYLHGLFLPGQVDFGGYFPYMRDWEAVFRARPDLRVWSVSYEELQADTYKKARELAEFLGSSCSPAAVKEIVDQCSFSSMRQRKGEWWVKEYGEAVMYRKGKVGDWKTWFTVADSEVVDAVCEREMEGSQYQMRYTL